MGKNYLVLARDDQSGYPKGRALAKADSKSIAAFLYEDIICRHGIFGRMVVDGGPENKGIVLELSRALELKRVQISAYNAQAAGRIEGGHEPIGNALSIETDGGITKWVPRLPGVLLADRATVNQSAGRTPFWMEHGYEPTLPLELRSPTWRTVSWHKAKTRGELLALRERQLRARDEDLEGTAARHRRKRQEAKDWTDDHRRLRATAIPIGRLVLVWDELHYVNMSSDAKLRYRWIRPYRVTSVDPDKRVYRLEQFDGTPLKGTYAGSRLKPVHRVADQYESDNEEDSLDHIQGNRESVDRAQAWIETLQSDTALAAVRKLANKYPDYEIAVSWVDSASKGKGIRTAREIMTADINNATAQKYQSMPFRPIRSTPTLLSSLGLGWGASGMLEGVDSDEEAAGEIEDVVIGDASREGNSESGDEEGVNLETPVPTRTESAAQERALEYYTSGGEFITVDEYDQSADPKGKGKACTTVVKKDPHLWM